MASPIPRAVVLSALLWPACLAGGSVGSVVGIIAGSAGSKPAEWWALGWGFLGAIVGFGVGAGLLGWIWALACGRRRLLPTAALAVLTGVGAGAGLTLLLPVPGSGSDVLRIVASCVIVVLVTALVFLIGRRTPARDAAHGRDGTGPTPA